MIPVLSSAQIKEADQFTIKNEPIDSIDLMERASEAFVNEFIHQFRDKNQKVKIFCGTGNNGGDGLAIARILMAKKWSVDIFIVGDPSKGSSDFKTNLGRVAKFQSIRSNGDFPDCENVIIIDALFGSGLSRPLEGIYKELILFLNDQDGSRVAVDIASGLFADMPISAGSVIFHPHFTYTFQVPKLSFFLPSNYKYVGEWRVLEIGLDPAFIQQSQTDYYLTSSEDMRSLLPLRGKFTHKNEVGRLLIVSGSKGKMGAAVLCAKAAFKAGVGLVNVCAPSCGTTILQIAIPEAMVIESAHELFIESIPETKDTVAIGPGLGTEKMTATALEQFLKNHEAPIVMDADGLNILAEHSELMKLVPQQSILTPHPGELKRLVGAWKNDFEKLEKLKEFCTLYQVNTVLKGAYSAVCNSEGLTFFNPTGNPGLATAGSGDVLTGIISAFLAQGLSPFEALKLGVYIHGLAGDLAVEQAGSGWIQASDIIESIADTVQDLKGQS